MSKTLSGQEGQAVLEAIVASSLILGLSFALMLSCYFGFVKIFSEYVLHEALVCKVTVTAFPSAVNCEQTLKNQFRKILVRQKLESIQWHQTRKSVGVTIHLSDLHFHSSQDTLPNTLALHWSFSKTLALPLKPSRQLL